MDLIRNPNRDAKPEDADDGAGVIAAEEHRRARREIEQWPGYAPTRLVELPGLARRSGVAEVRVKDEGGRFGLGSFKALGGAYGVFREVARELNARGEGDVVTAADLRTGRFADAARRVTVACATDGNHGRAVAWGAELAGCRAVVYLPAHVSDPRERAIAGHGARVVRIHGSYDEAVERVEEEARQRRWLVISDTSYRGGERIPRAVMHGYTVLVSEVEGRLSAGSRPTHVFLQGGVGGLAAAVAGYFRDVSTGPAPRFVVVEPREADALYQSARAGRPRAASGSLDTVMGGLSCGEVSPLAWKLLRGAVDAFVRISDEDAVEAMRTLAEGRAGDPPVVAGESGAAGAAGFLRVAESRRARETLELDDRSRVLLIVTEGATDPGRYRDLVGRAPGGVVDGGGSGR